MVTMATHLSDAFASTLIDHQAHRVVEVDGVSVPEVIRVWPSPACLWQDSDGVWMERSPLLHVSYANEAPEDCEVKIEDALGWNIPIGPLFALIPEDIRAALAPQDVGVCWLAMMLVDAVPQALAVVRDNPALGGLLALKVDAAEDRAAARDELRALLGGPRHHLLPLVGLPPRKSFVDVLGSVDPWVLGVPGAWVGGIPGHRHVINMLNSEIPEVQDWVKRLPRIRADVVIVLAHERTRALCTLDLLADAGNAVFFGLHNYLQTIANARRAGSAPATPARFRSRQEVMDFCTDLGSRPSCPA